MRELKYRDNNRHYYSYSTNYLSYNNIHHYQQQVQFKHSSSSFRIRQQTNQRQVFHSQQNNNTQNLTNKVLEKKMFLK